MSKAYWFTFNSGDPRSATGLTPTFILFFDQAGATYLPPGITEPMVGSGYYLAQYAPLATLSIAFLVDGGGALSSSDRYLQGSIDPIQVVDQRVGSTTDSFGSTSVDPTTLMGKMNRTQEFLEGNQVYVKSSGTWDIYSRGASVLLAEKTITNDTTSVERE